MKIQKIFQGTFKLISIIADFLYLTRQTVEHPNPNVICSLLINRQIRYWQMEIRIIPSIDVVYLRVHPKINPIIDQKQQKWIYIGCPRRKGPNSGRVFLRSNYTDITQNTYIQSSMVTEILAREKCGSLLCLRTLLCSWRHTSHMYLTFNARILQ